MAHIVMLLTNPYRPDPRVQEQASSLAGAGYEVTLICWDRQGEMPAEAVLPNGVRILRIQNVRAEYGGGLKQILFIPRFWSAAIKKTMPLKPDLVYCRDLDTLYAGVRIKQKLGCKLLFDAHEDYPSLMSLYLPGFAIPLLSFFQGQLLRQVDAAIAASSVNAQQISASGVEPTLYIPNVHDLAPFKNISDDLVNRARQELGINPGEIVIGYIGGFTRNRLLLPLIEAMHSIADITLILAGDGHQRQAVESSIRGMAHVHYLGWLPADQVPLYTRLCDIIYYCLKPDYPGAKFNAPNTLSYAMAAGRPVIANDLGDLGRIIRETGCGLLLEDSTPASIIRAIEALRDPVLRHSLGEAGRLAAEKEYNWQVVEQRLLGLYHALLESPG